MRNSAPVRPLDLFAVQSATDRNRLRIQELARQVQDCEQDVKRVARLSERECRWCFYLSGSMAGQAFTAWTCWVCGKDDMHSNTSTPRLCDECSDRLRLCRHCCADIELKRRRKLEVSP